MIMRMKRCDDAGVGGESKDELVDHSWPLSILLDTLWESSPESSSPVVRQILAMIMGGEAEQVMVYLSD